MRHQHREGCFTHYNEWLRNLRENNDLTQAEVADYLGTSPMMYARYERCVKEFLIRHLIFLSGYTGVPMIMISGECDEK